MSDFVILDGLHDARNLIYATWLRSYQSSSLITKNVPRDVFFAHHHRVLDGIFEREPIVKLAVMPESPEVVFGWSVTEPGVIHYVYVKPAFRRHGVARALLDHIEAPFAYTHHTYILRDLHRHVAGSAFNPYLLNSGGNIQ